MTRRPGDRTDAVLVVVLGVVALAQAALGWALGRRYPERTWDGGLTGFASRADAARWYGARGPR